MTPDGYAVLRAVLAAVAVGLLGAVLTALVSRRSPAAAAIAAPLVAVLSMAAGVWSGATTMLFDRARLSVLALVIAATVPIALLIGVTQARRVRALDAQRLREEARRHEALEVDRVRREVVAGVSHDLRTPLAGIRAMAEALEDGVGEGGDYLRRIRHEADRTSAMVDDLLALTTITTGPSPSAEPVDLADLVSDTLASVTATAAARGVQVHGSAPDALVVAGDARLLSRALLNLVVNAVQQTPRDGRVRVSAGLTDDRGAVQIAVTDSCGGIDPQHLADVFAPGWRGSDARTPHSGPLPSSGAGLGLAIVQAVAAAHHGEATVANVAGGCRFVLRLPRQASGSAYAPGELTRR